MKRTMLSITMVSMLVFLSGCAEKGPVLLDIGYRPPADVAAGTPRVVVGVSPFKDDRGKAASVLGRRVIASTGLENELVVQGTVADLVASRLKDALKARGITVKDVPAWDMTAENIKADGADIVIGGEIKTLWVEALSKLLNANTRADVQLRVSAADTAEKKIFRTLKLSSKLERQDIAFSFTQVENVLTEALSGALDQLLNDEEFKKKTK
jgi:predicted small lipoprotein YifL